MFVFTCIRFIFMILSLFGYSLFFKEKLKINRFISPLFSLSIVTLITYFSGLLKLLQYSSYIIFIVGLLLFIRKILGLRKEDFYNIEVINILNFMLLSCFIIISIILLSSKLIHYDNFSHWAIVVKQMLIENAFPNANSVLIDFKNYPLGTSSWIYYVCKMVGSKEGVMLAAQGTIIYASIYAFFSIIKDRKRLLFSSLILISIGVMNIFNVAIRMDNLLVDFVLPLVALAIIATIYFYKNNIKKCVYTILPIMSMLLIVKNNAIFFWAIATIYLLYIFLKSENKKKNFLKVLICIAVSLLVYGSWSYHVKNEFKDINFKFDISAKESEEDTVDNSAEDIEDQENTENQEVSNNEKIDKDKEDVISSNGGSKTSEEIEIVLNEFKSQVFNTKNNISMGFVYCNIAALIGCIILKRVNDKKHYSFKILLISDITFILYYIGILAMYIFMMPMDEAEYLAGFDRYSSSIMIFLVGIMTFSFVIDIENSFYIKQGRYRDIYAFKSLRTKKIYMNSTLVVSAVGLMLFLSEINGMTYLNKQYYETLPGKVEAIVGNNFFMDNSHYALYATDTNSQVSNYYLGYIARYMLMDPNVYVFSSFDDEYIRENIENFDYLVLVESDDEAKEYMQKHVNSEGEVGLYKISELFHK